MFTLTWRLSTMCRHLSTDLLELFDLLGRLLSGGKGTTRYNALASLREFVALPHPWQGSVNSATAIKVTFCSARTIFSCRQRVLQGDPLRPLSFAIPLQGVVLEQDSASWNTEDSTSTSQRVSSLHRTGVPHRAGMASISLEQSSGPPGFCFLKPPG